MAQSPILRHFSYRHLPEKLQEVSKPFYELANIVETLPNCAEKSTALRKLLEAKDCAVRAYIESLPPRIKLLRNVGGLTAGSIHSVKEVIPHGGNTDSAKQYLLEDGLTYIPSDYAEEI